MIRLLFPEYDLSFRVNMVHKWRQRAKSREYGVEHLAAYGMAFPSSLAGGLSEHIFANRQVESARNRLTGLEHKRSY
jgi:hypothetical protein